MAIFIEETGEIIHENSRTGVVTDTGEIDSRTQTKFLCSILTDLASSFSFSKGLKVEPIQRIGKQKADQKG